MFLYFISFVINGFDPEELIFPWDEDSPLYEKNKTDGYDYVIKRGYSYYEYCNHCSYAEFLEELNSFYESRQGFIKNHLNLRQEVGGKHVYQILLNDLMTFFKNAYQYNDFFRTVGITPQVQSKEDYLKIHHKEFEKKRKLESNIMRKYSDNDFYFKYQEAQLMSYFKDFMVRYMRYDSIERRLKLNPNEPKMFKVITTSCPNPNERFYNWLLKDWIVQRVPRMYLNEQEKRFVSENPVIDYYQTDKEIILGEEIASIKRLVPIQNREEYFRK